MRQSSAFMPVWAQVLLERLVPLKNRDAIIGDFVEMYAEIATREGRGVAVRWYLGQLLASIPSFLTNGIPLGGAMLNNYLRVARRNLAKRKFFSALNIGGLAIGMAISLLIFQYVAHETGYERHIQEVDRTFRVTRHFYENDVLDRIGSETFHAMAPLLESEVPEVERIARYHTARATVRVVGAAAPPVPFDDMGYVDPEFFDLLGYRALVGDPERALEEPGGVVLTESEAMRLFSSTDVIGTVLEVYGWSDLTGTVRAVVRDPVGPTHVRATLFQSIDDLLNDPNGQYAETSGWSWSNFYLYARLRPEADPELVATDMSRVLENASDNWSSESSRSLAGLQPIARIHLFNEADDTFASQGAYRRVLFVSIIGLFVLLIAWLNYVNLSTARAMERAKEVGIRKASGARRFQVASQFVLESIVVNGSALLLALIVADRCLPWLNTVAGIDVGSSSWLSARLWGMLLLVFGAGSIVASLYPAAVISAFDPAVILKSGRAGRTTARLRKTLVVFQFAISIALMSGTLIVYSQMNHLRDLSPGFDLDQILTVERPAIVSDQEAYAASRTAFLDQVRAIAGVTHVTTSTSVPGNGFNLRSIGRRQSVPREEAIMVDAFWAGDGFLETYGVELLEGRALTTAREGDHDAVLLNPAAVTELGFASAADAIGQTVILGSRTEFQVVGVTTDYAWLSRKTQSPPVMIALDAGGAFFSVKVAGGGVQNVVRQVEALFAGAFPGNAFNYRFADERFEELFREEERLGTLVSVFALFALLVAALGLVGLAALTASQRRKEISVRKVLGASTWSVSRLLTGDFAQLVTVGLFIAVPLTWWAATRWLNQFAHRIDPGVMTFLVPGLLVLLVAIGASSFHVWRAAVSSPVEGIRSE